MSEGFAVVAALDEERGIEGVVERLCGLELGVPTTVLAQNDSGIGVKNGINAFGTKNFLGTFEPPHAVLNDVTFLPTLDDRDWRAGISEAVKVALIKDAGFFIISEVILCIISKRCIL